MAIYRIRGVGIPAPVMAKQEVRDRAGYASARIEQILPTLGHSAEGRAFWEDVAKRLVQIKANGEIA